MEGKFLKLLIVTSLFITTIILITSCSNTTVTKLDTDNPVTINLWHYYKGSQMKILEEQIATFNETVGKKEGIIVTDISFRSAQEIYDQLILSANNEPGASKLPSLAMMYPDAGYELQKIDILTPFNKYVSSDTINGYIPAFIDEGKITATDDIYVFPISKSSEVLYINNTAYQRFLDEYNKANPDNKIGESMLATFEGLLETAKIYYEWTDSKTENISNDGKALFGMDSPCNFAIAGYNQLGKNFFSEDSEGIMGVNFDSPAFEKLWEHYYVPMVKGYFASYSFYRAEDTQIGDIIMYTGSTGGASFFPSTVTYADNKQEDIQLKVLPYPTFEGGTSSAVQQGAGFGLCKTTDKEEYAASLFMAWLTNSDNNVDFILGSGYLPVTEKAFNTTLPTKLNKNSATIQEANITKVIKLATETYNDIGFYTYKPFDYSEDIRFYFEEMFLEKANHAHEEFTNYMNNNHTFSEAVDKFLSNDSMNNFIKEAQYDISEIQNN